MARITSVLALLLALALLSSCYDGADVPEGERRAGEAWEAYEDTQTDRTYLAFIHLNRTAAMKHGNPDDATGIRYQVRALTVQSVEAVRISDGDLARQVDERVAELVRTGLIDVYEEELNGSHEKFLKAKERVGALIP